MKRSEIRAGSHTPLLTRVGRKSVWVWVRYLRFAAHEQGCRKQQDTWGVVEADGTWHDRTARELRRPKSFKPAQAEIISDRARYVPGKGAK